MRFLLFQGKQDFYGFTVDLDFLPNFLVEQSLDCCIGSVIFLAFHKFQLDCNDHCDGNFLFKWPPGKNSPATLNWKNIKGGEKMNGIISFFFFFTIWKWKSIKLKNQQIIGCNSPASSPLGAFNVFQSQQRKSRGAALLKIETVKIIIKTFSVNQEMLN